MAWSSLLTPTGAEGGQAGEQAETLRRGRLARPDRRDTGHADERALTDRTDRLLSREGAKQAGHQARLASPTVPARCPLQKPTGHGALLGFALSGSAATANGARQGGHGAL
jgi:hypothetical protein